MITHAKNSRIFILPLLAILNALPTLAQRAADAKKLVAVPQLHPFNGEVRPLVRNPAIHGDTIAFSCEGDIWTADIKTGQAIRLTRGEGIEDDPRFSPDGKEIAFSANYDGANEIYVIPVEGGAPRRVTFGAQVTRLLDWTEGGKKLFFLAPARVGKTLIPYSVAASGGFPSPLPMETTGFLSSAPDGNRIAFNRFLRADAPWFRYEGGWKNDVWLGDLKTLQFRKVYQGKYTCEYPTWAGDRIAFAADEGGDFSVLSVKPDGKEVKRLAGPFAEEIRHLASDGKKIVYERGLALEVCDLASGKITPITLHLTSDLIHTRPYLASASEQVFGVSIGSTGKRVYVETRGQIVSLATKEGDARVLLAKDGARFRAATLSPDAKSLAYISDETGEQQLYISDPEGLKPRAMTLDKNRQLKTVVWSPDSKWIAITDSLKHLRLISAETGKETMVSSTNGWDGPEPRFSPDSRWMVYSRNNNLLQSSVILLYEIATGKEKTLSQNIAIDASPVFSSDGKWIAFLSYRSVNPRNDGFLNQLSTDNPVKAYLLALKKETRSPFLPDNNEETPASLEPKKDPVTAKPVKTEIDFENLSDRFVEIPVAPANYSRIAVISERVLLLGSKTGETTKTLSYFDLKDKKNGIIAENVSDFDVSADGKKLLLTNKSESRVVDVTAEKVSPVDGKLNFANLQLAIDPVAEWKDEYWDAWRLIRDYFYVANMHGVDWPSVGKKYAALLPSVRSRGELNQLIRWMLAELSVSHAGVFGGRLKAVTIQNQAPSFLGIDAAPDASGYFKISRIIHGDGFTESERSPLAAPGLNVKEGDYLIEIANRSTKETKEFQSSLVGRAGQIVAIKVNDKPSLEGARTIRIKPIANEGRMRYIEWVKDRRDYVSRASSGHLGYIHLDNMTEADMADFIRQYFPQRDKDALVIDIRFNGGGNICTFVLNVLRQKRLAFFNMRGDDKPWTRQGDFFDGPMACLINEQNSSCGEEFPYYFREMKLGPLIGKRTWGGEVGNDPGWPLADGGVVLVPNYGAWTPEKGWIIEQRGVSPDIEVENDPTVFATGKDQQMDRAVTYLLDELKKNPPKKIQQPPDPVRTGKRQGLGIRE